MATDHYVDNLNKIRLLAVKVKALDLLDPDGHTVGVLTEIIDRAKRIPELEQMDFEMDFNFDKIEAEA
tara:strand:+ start:1493 stop:1696 length:204 start_codon:yes stop_codon:yes gene_type:complete